MLKFGFFSGDAVDTGDGKVVPSEVTVKTEQQAKDQQAVDALKATSSEVHVQHQVMLTETKAMIVKATGKDYQDRFVSDLEKHKRGLTSLVNMLETITLEGGYDESKLPVLLKNIKAFGIAHSGFVEHGAKICFVKPPRIGGRKSQK